MNIHGTWGLACPIVTTAQDDLGVWSVEVVWGFNCVFVCVCFNLLAVPLFWLFYSYISLVYIAPIQYIFSWGVSPVLTYFFWFANFISSPAFKICFYPLLCLKFFFCCYDLWGFESEWW